ncbi:hypothetical protein ACOME3_009259 [Neoechinorhynchus agilis]
MQLSHDEEFSLRRKALSICREYLGGSWQFIRDDEFDFSRVTGGLSNYIFKCSLQNNDPRGDQEEEEDSPKKVLLRVFGPHVSDRSSEVLKDAIVSTLLAEWKIGPKVYAVRTTCRLEEFLEGSKLHVNEFRSIPVAQSVARVLARFHGFVLPFKKQPRWLFETIQNYLRNIQRYDFKKEYDRSLYQILIQKFDLYKEYADMRSIVLSVDSPVVFCHNDAQPGNVIMINGHARLIDYEYSAYNFRGFDFGNMFCEFMFDYNCSNYPFFECHFGAFPSKETQEQILEEYLKEFHKKSQITEKVQLLRRESEFFSLASDFMWAMWAIYMTFDSRINFGYMEYAVCRMYSYHVKKQQLLNGDHAAGLFDVGGQQNDPNWYKDLLNSIKPIQTTDRPINHHHHHHHGIDTLGKNS